jgi:hypothetical protein
MAGTLTSFRVVVSGGGSALAVSGRTPSRPAAPTSAPLTNSRRVQSMVQLLFNDLIRLEEE